jgi:steroid delta-isomerase
VRHQWTRVADAWIANWDRRDVEAVLGHFADGAEFVIPMPRDEIGEAVLAGKAQIGAYWHAALARIPVNSATFR